MKSYIKTIALLLSLAGLFACHSSRMSTISTPRDIQWREPGTSSAATSLTDAATTELDSSLIRAQEGNLLLKAPSKDELTASTSANTALLSKVKELSRKPTVALEAMTQSKKLPSSRLMNLVTKMAIKKIIRKSEKSQAKADDDDKPRRNSMTRNNFFIIGAVFLAAGVLLIIFGGVPGTIIASIMGLILLVAALALLIAALALNLFNGNSISIG